MNAKKPVIGLAVSGTLLMALSGCYGGGGGGPAAPVDLSEVDYNGTITMITKFSDPTTADYFPTMAAAYEELHPGVTVKIEQESDQGYKDKIKVLASSNSIPDIYFTWAGQTAKQYVDAGLALDLTSVIGPGTEWNESLVPSAVAAGVYDGKNYAVPFDLDAKFMVYNTKIFQENGVEVPTTLEELFDVCDALTAKGVVPINFGNVDAWPTALYLTQLNAYNVPTSVRDVDYNTPGSPYSDPGYVESLVQMREILDRCTNTGNSANGIDHYDAIVGFGAGKAAMMYLEWVEFGLLDDSQIIDDGWDFFPLPASKDAKGSLDALAGSPDEFLINPNAENPALAVDFMRFVVSKANAEKMSTLMIGYPSSVVGTVTAANATPQSLKAADLVSQAGEFAIWLDQATRPVVSTAYLAGGEALVSGSSTPEEVMETVQQASASPENN